MSASTSAALARFRAAEAAGGVVLEGFHAVKHALRFGREPLELLTPDPDGMADLADTLAPDVAGALTLAQPVTAAQAATLAPRLASPCLAVVARPTSPPVEAWDSRAPIVVVERPRHAGNLGAVVRVAAAAGAAGVAVVDGPSPWDRAVVRASAGLVVCTPLLALDDVGSLRTALRRSGRVLVAMDPDGAAWPGELSRHPAPRRAAPAMAFGSERHGLSGELRAAAVGSVRLGMRPGVSSLNLATAVSAALYALGAPWPPDGAVEPALPEAR